MTTFLDPARFLRAACTAMTLVLIGIMSIVPFSAAAQSTPAPTVGDIVVDTYDCITGELGFHVAVTDLLHMPAAQGNGHLGFEVYGQYEQGPLDTSIPAHGFNVQAQLAPYTGDVFLNAIVPPSIDDAGGGGPSGAITAIQIKVAVTDPDGGIAYSQSTFSVDCTAAAAQHDQLVQQLIAELVHILDDLLNG